MAAKTVVITGGAGGIGSTLARILVERGENVVLFGRDRDRLETLVSELGSASLAVQGDAKNLSDLESAVELGVARFGSLDGLAHCVGSIRLKALHLTSPQEFTEILETNLLTAFLACRAVLGPMRAQKSGSIVLVSSVAATQGLNNHEGISSAKAGIDGLVRASAMTYARQGIRFNAVAPALTETPLAAPFLKSEAARSFSEGMHPLGRVGAPGDIARPMAYLLSDEASWITGQIWGIDGGLSAGIAPPKPVVTSNVSN